MRGFYLNQAKMEIKVKILDNYSGETPHYIPFYKFQSVINILLIENSTRKL
jgi:hypothetical protein